MLPGIWLTFGVDTFIEALPGRGNSPRAGIHFEPDGSITFTPEHRALEGNWYAGLNAMAQAGASLILDEVMLAGAVGQERLRSAFTGTELIWVAVRCEAEIAAEREADRPDRVPGMARQQATSVHLHVNYHIEVDTSRRSVADCAAEISRRLTEDFLDG